MKRTTGKGSRVKKGKKGGWVKVVVAVGEISKGRDTSKGARGKKGWMGKGSRTGRERK